jgi:hypothetical protein
MGACTTDADCEADSVCGAIAGAACGRTALTGCSPICPETGTTTPRHTSTTTTATTSTTTTTQVFPLGCASGTWSFVGHFVDAFPGTDVCGWPAQVAAVVGDTDMQTLTVYWGLVHDGWTGGLFPEIEVIASDAAVRPDVMQTDIIGCDSDKTVDVQLLVFGSVPYPVGTPVDSELAIDGIATAAIPTARAYAVEWSKTPDPITEATVPVCSAVWEGMITR